MTTTYAVIKARNSTETLTIVHTEAPSTIHTTATSSDVTHAIQHEPDYGLLVDFSDVQAPSCTLLLVWTNQASHSVKVVHEPQVTAILDQSNPRHEIERSCEAEPLVCSLFLPTDETLSEWGPDPKIKIIPPTCS